MLKRFAEFTNRRIQLGIRARKPGVETRKSGIVIANLRNRTRPRTGLRPRFSIVSLIPTVYAPAFLLAVGQGVLIPVLPVLCEG